MRNIRPGVTLTELIVVIGVIGLLAFFGLPAIEALLNSFENESGSRALIRSALGLARATAAAENRYAGVRFQRATQPDKNDSQYIIFIISDSPENMTDANDPPELESVWSGFRAVAGRKPLKLPASIGVMDMMVGSANDSQLLFGELTDIELTDAMSFTILFSPRGKLVQIPVRVRNKDGYSGTSTSMLSSDDDIFNTYARITDPENPAGMFTQDDYPGFGLRQELSRNGFVMFDRRMLVDGDNDGTANYLASLDKVYINAYTGELIRSR